MKSGPGRVANADAEVIRAYLAAVGIAVDAARLNLLLALLGVALLECGAGLMAFAIGEGTTSRLADAATSANQVAKDPRVALPIVLPGQLRLTDGDQQDDPQDDTRNDRSVEPHAEPAPAGDRTMNDPQDDEQNDSLADAGRRTIELVRAKGGVLVGSQRTIGEALGLSKSRMNAVLHSLNDAGHVRLATSGRRTVVELVRVAAGA